jgi:hypothetical protein
MRSRICIVFIFTFWFALANSANAQGGDATVTPPVKKPATKTKKEATVKQPSSPKTNTAKQTPKSKNSTLSKTGNKTSVMIGALDKPLTLAQILTGLQTPGKTSETRTFEARNKFIAAQVRQRGVSFELNEDREQDLRDAGATDELINVIQAMAVAKLKPLDGVEVTELRNPNDGQIEITRNTGGLRLVQYFIFLLTNASNGLYISTEEELKHSVRCEFEGGGTNCKQTDLVAYKKLLGPFATFEEAQTGLCRSITETRNFQLGIGLKGRWQGSDNWYGLWDASIDNCLSRTDGKQTETKQTRSGIGESLGKIIEGMGNGAAIGTIRTNNGVMELNVTYNGDTLTYYRGTTAEQCQTDCVKNGNCQGFTYVKENGYQKGDPPMCYLISRISGSVSHSCCVSGRKP